MKIKKFITFLSSETMECLEFNKILGKKDVTTKVTGTQICLFINFGSINKLVKHVQKIQKQSLMGFR